MLGTSQTLNKGRYQIISSFSQDASGGMYEALDTINNTPVILRESVGTSGKIATPSQMEAINAAFTGEAMVLADIEHDCLVSVRDYFSEIDRQYLVLESLTGQNLTKYLEPHAERPAVREVLLWADQLLNGLQYLHKLTPPIIHSTVTPENLKLTSNLKIKLLTTKISSSSQPRANKAGPFTEDPAFAYRPLEDLWKDLNDVTQRVILNSFDETSASVLLRPLDARSDLYSAAASLYHVLTGAAPCDALERSIAILDGKSDPLQRPCDIDPEIAPEISDAFMRALSLRRENRFESAMIMRQVLRTAVVRAQERAAGISQSQADPAVVAKPVITEDQLDIESKRAEERDREIEAEQAMLDKEQKRIEKRRLELVAERERQAAERERLKQEAELEQKRLIREKLELEAEQERQRVALRLADLEAERAKERAEEERLELEAQEEQRRAQERLQELKLEQERHRAEQKRIELEARKELELAEERIKELSLSGLKIEDLTKDEQIEPEEVLDLSTPSYPETPNPFDAEFLGEKETQVPHFSQQPGINFRVPAIVGGVFAVVAIAVWGLMTITAPSSSTLQVGQQAAIPVVEQPVDRIPEPLPVFIHEQPAVEQTAVVDSSTSTLVPPSDVQPNTPRRLQTAAIQKKPAPERSVPAKKKVTVDDLINDN